MFELLDIAGAYKTTNKYMIVEKYYDIENNKIIYILYINNDSENENDNVIEYKWYDNNSTDINNLLIFLKTIGGSYYDENNEILYGPDITNISLDVSYEITNYEFNYGNEWKKNDFLQKLPYNLGYFTTKYNYIYNRYDFVEDDIKITHEFITDSTIDSVKYNDYIKHKNLKHKFIISI